MFHRIEVECDGITVSSGGCVWREGEAIHADHDIVVGCESKSHKGGAGDD